MQDADIIATMERKLECAILCANRDCIPICQSNAYRAKVKNGAWDYRRDNAGNLLHMYAIDLLIIGRKITSNYANRNGDIARIFGITPFCVDSFEAGWLDYDGDFYGTPYSYYVAGRRMIAKLRYKLK